MELLNDTILNALENLKANYKPALAGEIYYASSLWLHGVLAVSRVPVVVRQDALVAAEEAVAVLVADLIR